MLVDENMFVFVPTITHTYTHTLGSVVIIYIMYKCFISSVFSTGFLSPEQIAGKCPNQKEVGFFVSHPQTSATLKTQK